MIRTCAGDPSEWLRQHSQKKPLFACILSFTRTGLIPQISAAGTTPQARTYTAIADAEYLINGSTHHLPPLAAGISPAVLSRAILTALKVPIHLLSTGLPDKLSVPHTALPQIIAKSVQTGQAMTLGQTKALFESGLHWGDRLAQSCPDGYLILGECVVGGTTTAQAVLTALGYDVAGRMSSSHLNSNHLQKTALVNQGLRHWQQQPERSPLAAIAACGDPMQAVAAGITLAASRRIGVLLAGGSQMLAVYAIAQALDIQHSYHWKTQRVVVGTTRWVIEDRSADTVAIAREIGAPYLASEINFSQSPYFQLRAYEQGFVKEGVGAGGCAIAAHLYKSQTRSQLRHLIEAELRRCL